MKQLRIPLRFVLSLVLALSGSVANAAPLDVGFTSTGNPGNWILRFWVKNPAAASPLQLRVFAFGLKLSQDSELETAPGFDTRYLQEWNHVGAGGTNTNYNHAWITMSATEEQGEVLNEFVVHSTDEEAPISVPWFVQATSTSKTEYSGEDYFGSRVEPGFEGLALAVPEPATYGLFGLGMAGIAWMRWRASKASSADTD